MTTEKSHGFLAWLVCVAGWLLCAALCLRTTLALEAYPYAYEMFFPAVILILFCNIFLFLFIVTKWKGEMGRLVGSVARVCLAEAILLGGMFAIGKYLM